MSHERRPSQKLAARRPRIDDPRRFRGPRAPIDERRLILGLQAVREALRVRGSDLEVLVEEGESPELAALARFATDQGAKVRKAARSELDRTSRGGRHQGALAFAPHLRVLASTDFELEKTDIVVALDELEDPQNFGAIIRSSVALGARAIVWPEHHSAPLTPATFRASAGAIEHATLARVPSLPEALLQLKARGAHVVGLDANGTADASQLPRDVPLVLVVGAEGKGLRKPVKSACDALLRLPMAGPIASLNASVATGIALYAALTARAMK